MANKMVLAALFSIASYFVYVQGIDMDDPCTIISNGFSSEDGGGEVTVPSSCMNGSLWWNYPLRFQEVHFQQAQLFTVCLQSIMGPYVKSLRQLLNNDDVHVEVPDSGEAEVCMPQADQNIVILMEAPEPQAYMTLYSYKIQFQF